MALYGSIWYLYFRVMKFLRKSETYPRFYGSFRISLTGVCWPRWTDWRLPSLLTRLPRAARVSMSEHGKRCNKSSCESSNIGESQYAKMIEHAWLLRHKPSELGFCSWIPIIEKRCKIVESCTQRKLVGLAVSIGWHVGQTWPNMAKLYYALPSSAWKGALSTPEPKPDTKDTHVLLDGNLGWGPNLWYSN